MEGDKRSWRGHWLWEAAAAKLYYLGFWNLYCRHLVDRTVSHCFGFKMGGKSSEWRKLKVGSWRGRRGGSESKVGNGSGFTKICCIKATLCYPFPVVNINAPFLRHILKRMSEYCANEKAKSWRGQRGAKCTFTEHLSRQKRKAVKLQPNHIFLASYVGFDMGWSKLV